MTVRRGQRIWASGVFVVHHLADRTADILQHGCVRNGSWVSYLLGVTASSSKPVRVITTAAVGGPSRSRWCSPAKSMGPEPGSRRSRSPLEVGHVRSSVSERVVASRCHSEERRKDSANRSAAARTAGACMRPGCLVSLSKGPETETAATTLPDGERTGAETDATPVSRSPTDCAHPRRRMAESAVAE